MAGTMARSLLVLLCFCLFLAAGYARSFDYTEQAFHLPLVGIDTFNHTNKPDSAQFIMTGYQPTSFRSRDCDVSIPGVSEPYMLTVVNWYGMYWSFDAKKEKIHVVIEAETRGWVGVAFGGSSLDTTPAEAVIGWIQKSDAGASHDVSHIGSHTLASGWDGIMNPANENSKKVPLESASVCQTRDGRTVLRFTRKTKTGKYPIKTQSGSYQLAYMAVGRDDNISQPLESTRMLWAAVQSRTETEVEDDSWNRIYQLVLILFHVFSWFIR